MNISSDARGLPTSRHSPTVFDSMGFESRQAAVARMKEPRYEEAFRVAYPTEENPLNAAMGP